jgi:protein transport protein SEC24
LRKPRPLGRVFVIDVSGPSVHRGIVREVCEGIRRALYGSKAKSEQDRETEGEVEEVDEDTLGADERIAIVTVADRLLELIGAFCGLHLDAELMNQPNISSPSLLVVSDLDDMYCPLINGYLVNPTQSR